MVKGNQFFVDTINGFNELVISYNIANPASPVYEQTGSLNSHDPNALSIYSSYLYVLAHDGNGPSASTVYIFKI